MDPASLIISATVAAANAGAIGAGTAAGIAGAAGSIGSVIGAAGLGMSALGSIAQGRQAAASAKYNAAVQANNATIAKRNADFAIQEGNANVAAEQLKTRATVGAIKANQAASGVDVGSRSSVDVRSSARELGQLNAINIRSNATRKAYGYQTEAYSDTQQSKLYEAEAKYDKQAGMMEAGSTLLTGAYEGSKLGLWGKFTSEKSLGG